MRGLKLLRDSPFLSFAILPSTLQTKKVFQSIFRRVKFSNLINFPWFVNVASLRSNGEKIAENVLIECFLRKFAWREKSCQNFFESVILNFVSWIISISKILVMNSRSCHYRRWSCQFYRHNGIFYDSTRFWNNPFVNVHSWNRIRR